MKSHAPKYRRQKRRGRPDLAFVELNGQRHYLGPFGSPDSREQYARIIRAWRGTGGFAPVEADAITVNEIIAAWWTHAEVSYQTREPENFRPVLREIAALYGSMRARDFGPVELEIIRDGLIERGLTRGYINGQIARAKRVFRWALSKRLVAPDVVMSLEALPGLRRGRSGAKEANPVTPVDEVSVNAVLPYLSTAVASMVRLQWLTGARSGELFVMRPMDINTTGPVWTYDVPHHKTEHHGKTRRIPLGPQAQDILIPLLAGRPRAEFVFSPKESAEEHRERRRQARNTPVGHGNATGTNRKARPEREPGESFSRSAYGLAVRRACDKAGVARWNPHQVRHSFGTRVRREHGLEAAQVLLGHSRADVTQVYAERDQRLAADVALRIG